MILARRLARVDASLAGCSVILARRSLGDRAAAELIAARPARLIARQLAGGSRCVRSLAPPDSLGSAVFVELTVLFAPASGSFLRQPGNP